MRFNRPLTGQLPNTWIPGLGCSDLSGYNVIGALDTLATFEDSPKLADVKLLPWWVVFGGLIGSAVVAGGAAIATIIGAAIFFVCLIAGQLVGSTIVDHKGAFGLAKHSISITWLMDLRLVLLGVLLVQFDRT